MKIDVFDNPQREERLKKERLKDHYIIKTFGYWHVIRHKNEKVAFVESFKYVYEIDLQRDIGPYSGHYKNQTRIKKWLNQMESKVFFKSNEEDIKQAILYCEEYNSQ